MLVFPLHHAVSVADLFGYQDAVRGRAVGFGGGGHDEYRINFIGQILLAGPPVLGSIGF